MNLTIKRLLQCSVSAKGTLNSFLPKSKLIEYTIIRKHLPLLLDLLPKSWHRTLQRHSYFCFSGLFLWNAAHQLQKGALIDLGTRKYCYYNTHKQHFHFQGTSAHHFYAITAINYVVLSQGAFQTVSLVKYDLIKDESGLYLDQTNDF